MSEKCTKQSSVSELGNAIFKYEMAYRDSIHSYVAQYNSIGDAFPYYLGLPLRRIVVDCIDGIVLARYPAEEDGFEVWPMTGETVVTAATKLTGGPFPFDLPRLLGEGKVMYEIRNLEAQLDQDGNPYGIWPWHSIHLNTKKDVSHWTPAVARADAANEIHNYVSARLMGVNAPTTIADQNAFEKESLRRYESSVSSFRSLLDTLPAEDRLQEFLAKNPAILALDAARVVPKYPLGKEWITDFVLELGRQQYVLVEIESARHPMYTREKNPKKRKPSAGLDNAIQQIENWRIWMRRGFLTMHDDFPGIEDPEYWIVIGRNPRERTDRRTLQQKKSSLLPTRLFTYDDLLDRAERHLARLMERDKG